jgi:hypothetical protein
MIYKILLKPDLGKSIRESLDLIKSLDEPNSVFELEIKIKEFNKKYIQKDKYNQILNILLSQNELQHNVEYDITYSFGNIREIVSNNKSIFMRKTRIKDVELKKKPTKEDLEIVTKQIIDEITSIENEEQKILRKVESINGEIGKLQKEEEILYQTIKKRYPKLSDQEIKEEIQSNLEE